MNKKASIPLFVDLDGTLVKLDTLLQALFLLLRRNPISLFRLPFWLLKGKAFLKEQIMQRVELDASTLPYNQLFLDFLKKEHSSGRELILATASNYRSAQAVADHLGLFTKVLSSDKETNLRGDTKRNAIQTMHSEYAYAGNDRADFAVWDNASEIILVNPPKAARIAYGKKADHLFEDRRPFIRMVLKAIRCQQWLKNALIFSPMVLAHRFLEGSTLIEATLAFASFSLVASSIYILNDLFDLSADQHHPRKSKRPFASGDLPIGFGVLLMVILSLSGLLLGSLLSPTFCLILVVYYIMTTLYTWRLKSIAIIDVLTLTSLYSMRIVAGSVATDTPISSWFIVFALFLFLSIALVKRLSELVEMKQSHNTTLTSRERGYQVEDLPLLLALGTSSGYLAVFVFTMYLSSDAVRELYSHPQWLGAFCPILLLWISRLWLLAWRGQIKDDPLAFAAKDFYTYAIALLSLAILLISR